MVRTICTFCMIRIVVLLFCAVVSVSGQGLVWNAPIDVAPKSAGNLHPRIVLDARGNPIVLWGQSGTGRIRCARWDGTAFVDSKILNDGTMPAFYENWAGPEIASHGDTVYVVFKKTPENLNHVYCIASYDGAKTFQAPVVVDNIADSLSRFPSVCVDANGNPVVAFMKFDLGFSNARWSVCRSTNAGQSFGADVRSGTEGMDRACDCCPGTVCSVGDDVLVTFRANLDNHRDAWLGLSTDNGAHFATCCDVDGHDWIINACPASGPTSCIVHDSILLTASMNETSGSSRVYVNRCVVGKQITAQSQPVDAKNSTISWQNYPRVAAFGNSVALTWIQSTANSVSAMMQFYPDGIDDANSLLQAAATESTSGINNADVAVSSSRVYVVYEDDAKGTVSMRSASYGADKVASDTRAALTSTASFVDDSHVALHGQQETGMLHLRLYSILGECVAAAELQSNRDVLWTIPPVPAGCYVLSVEDEMGHRRTNVLSH